jgi:type IV pilus assembly protein PilW
MRRQRGVTLIEAMVGIVVGLLVGLAAAGTAQVFMASQRQGMGAGGANMNASTAMTLIRQDIGQAGLGFFGEGQYLCNRMNLSVGNTLKLDNDLFTPVRATRTAGQLFDKLDLVYSTHIAGGTTVYTTDTSVGASVILESLLPAQVGEAVMLSASSAVRTCTVRSVTGVIDATPTTTQTLVFAPNGLHNSNAVTFTPAPAVPTGSSVALLGSLVMRSYSVDAQNNLVMTDTLNGRTAVLANDVVAFRLEYGTSANVGATTLSAWESPSVFGVPDAANISRLRAVRIGLVTRSPQREKPNKDGVCEASRVKPRLFDEEITDPQAAGNDWQCFRYRVATAVVPLRNVVTGLPGGDIAILGGRKVP